MEKQPLILIGGGGHCKSVIDVVSLCGRYEIVGVLDVASQVGQQVLGHTIVGTDEDIPAFCAKGAHFLITLGQIKSSKVRESIAGKIEAAGGQLATVVSPLARVSPWASIGAGTVVMHHAIANAECVIGRHCIINNGALVEHEANVGDFCHVSTRAVLNGNVQVGRGAFIGSASVVIQGASVGDHATVGAGSVVVKSVPNHTIVIGNPARQI